MWGSSHWMHFGLGETVARRRQNTDSDGGTYATEKPDDWKAADGILPSIPEKPKVEEENSTSPGKK